MAAVHLGAADLLENGNSNSIRVIQDVLRDGRSGPEMVVVPIEGDKVANCISQKVCDETITEILRSMITVPYAISKYEITFDDYDHYCETTGRAKPEDNGWGRGLVE